MHLETIQNFIITIINSTDEPEVQRILGNTRLQLEDLLIKNAPEILPEEFQLPTKQMRVDAYRKRTNVTNTVAHAVINHAWRKAQRGNYA